jgi:cysteine-rich repeat protein
MRIRHKAIEAIAALALAMPLVACTGDTTSDRSALSGEGSNSSADDDCTLTQGYWKNHPDAWPVSSLKLGSVTYSKDELIAIFKTPVKGNGLISLAHQLIAAKLNIAAGASDVSIKASISAADSLIGSLVCPPKGDGKLSTSATSSLVGKLDAFNSGDVGPGHCGDNGGGGGGSDDTCDHDTDGDGHCDSEPVCGNGILEDGEQCDDGNTLPGDGCCDLCEIEVPVCGNGIVEQGEHCDDGNTLNGDGCSSACVCECP